MLPLLIEKGVCEKEGESPVPEQPTRFLQGSRIGKREKGQRAAHPFEEKKVCARRERVLGNWELAADGIRNEHKKQEKRIK